MTQDTQGSTVASGHPNRPTGSALEVWMPQPSFDSVQSAFEWFEREIVRVPKPQIEDAKYVHPILRETLAERLKEHIETFLSGSYSRHVQSVRLKDVDIIVVLDDADRRFAGSARLALEAIAAAAQQSDLVRVTEVRHRAVCVWLRDYEFTVDLVAALEPASGDGLLLARHLPDEGYDDWTLANPRGQREAAASKNASVGGMYVPTVRLVKFWLNTAWGEKRPFKSYHAESVLYWALARRLDFADALELFFGAAINALADDARTRDPGAPATFVDERLEPDERQQARRVVERALEQVRHAQGATTVGDALTAWGAVFGPAFPTSATTTKSLADALRSGTAGVVGTGLLPGRGRQVIPSRPWRP